MGPFQNKKNNNFILLKHDTENQLIYNEIRLQK